jgi:hypothetical protein
MRHGSLQDGIALTFQKMVAEVLLQFRRIMVRQLLRMRIGDGDLPENSAGSSAM